MQANQKKPKEDQNDMSYFEDEDMGPSDNDEVMLDVKDLKQPQEAEDNNSTVSSESKNIVIIDSHI